MDAYCRDAYEMEGHRLYPTWTYARQELGPDASPFGQQEFEVRHEPRLGTKQHHSSVVDAHRVEGEHLYAGRVLTHPSRIVAPLLLASNQPQTFDDPHYVIAWAPNPIVQRSFGQYTVVPDDTVPRVPKLLPGYSTNALSQQELADEAALKVRRALYGR